MTIVKTDYSGKGHKHRTHRSKKGRKKLSKEKRKLMIEYKKKKNHLKEPDLNI